MTPVTRLTFDGGTLLATGLSPQVPPEDWGDGEHVNWAWDRRVGAWRCDAIHYAAVRRRLHRSLESRFYDEVTKPPPIHWPGVELPTLRPEQADALAGWRLHSGRGQVIMPTGTGKTEVALHAMAETRAATLVVAPVRDLMYQWQRRILRGLGYDAGIVGDNLFNLQPVTVTTYDT